MKKILFMMLMIILVAVLIFAVVTIAYAAGENDVADATEDGFYTWEMLATYAGCLAATTIVTQFLKGIWPAKIPTQFLCYIIAVTVLILANLFMKTLTWETAGISVLNAVVVALAANGVYNNIVQVKAISNTG